jgi:uncharacterized OB-fold protein
MHGGRDTSASSMITSHCQDFVDRAAQDSGYPLQRCLCCGWIPNFPRVCCTRCLGELEWFTGSGAGVISACAVVWRTHAKRYELHVPIVMSHIRLAEGPEVIASVIGDNRLTAEIGMQVMRACSGSWSALPQFRIAG